MTPALNTKDTSQPIISVEDLDAVSNAVLEADNIPDILLDDGAAVSAKILLADLADFHKHLEDRRVEAKAPYLAAGRAIDAAFKDPLSRLADGVAKVRSRLTAYAVKAAAAKLEADKKAAEEATRPGAVPPITTAVIESRAARPVVSTRTSYTYATENADAIPREYLTPDWPKIIAAWDRGTPVPGTKRTSELKAVNR